MPVPELDHDACRGRQKRFLESLPALGADAAVLTRRESVQWLTGAWVGPLFHPAAVIEASGRVTLAMPSRKAGTPSVADEVVTYEEKWLSTMRDAPDQRAASLASLHSACADLPARVACEFTDAPRQLTEQWSCAWVDIDATMFRLRRRKDPDELALMAKANEANRAMYAFARDTIQPGANELDVYNALHRVAVATLGEPLTYFGQDFRCAARGGAPRDRRAQAGELYILDLGVGLRGYHTDNARTFAVGGNPTDQQQQAWEKLATVFPVIESAVKPGVSCKAIFQQLHEMLADASPWVFNHHLGHGVGLAPHEGPHLNPNWDDTFQQGDYFTVEPGLYHDELNHGIRLEQNYVVTSQGVDLLTDWPLEL